MESCWRTAASKEDFDFQTTRHANSANKKKSLECQSLPVTSHKMNYRLTQLLWALWLDYITHESLKSVVPVTVSNTSSVIVLTHNSMKARFIFSTPPASNVFTPFYIQTSLKQPFPVQTTRLFSSFDRGGFSHCHKSSREENLCSYLSTVKY